MTNARKSGSGILAAGGIAALLASTCCLGPLILVLLGFSGAWIGNLTLLEPYRPWFLLFTVLTLGFAARRIFRPAQECDSSGYCSRPHSRIQKTAFGAVVVLSLIAFAFPYFARFFY